MIVIGHGVSKKNEGVGALFINVSMHEVVRGLIVSFGYFHLDTPYFHFTI